MKNAVPLITSGGVPTAIQNPWNTTVMPLSFRWKLIGIMVGNCIVLCLWQYVFVNGVLAQKIAGKKAVIEAKTEAELNASSTKKSAASKDMRADDSRKDESGTFLEATE
jgi:hypothetical protein